jgi:hypothetical protein
LVRIKQEDYITIIAVIDNPAKVSSTTYKKPKHPINIDYIKVVLRLPYFSAILALLRKG